MSKEIINLVFEREIVYKFLVLLSEEFYTKKGGPFHKNIVKGRRDTDLSSVEFLIYLFLSCSPLKTNKMGKYQIGTVNCERRSKKEIKKSDKNILPESTKIVKSKNRLDGKRRNDTETALKKRPKVDISSKAENNNTVNHNIDKSIKKKSKKEQTALSKVNGQSKSNEIDLKEKRLKRFSETKAAASNDKQPEKVSQMIKKGINNELKNIKTVDQTDTHRQVGNSKQLEKEYIRPASSPNLEEVRSVGALKKSLLHVAKRRKELQGDSRRDYTWEQMRSIRQDLVIQGEHSEFAALCYVVHARFCIKDKDLQGLSVCLMKLSGLPGHGEDPLYVSMRIIMMALQTLCTDSSFHSEVVSYDGNCEGIKSALELAAAINTFNVPMFSKFRKKAPQIIQELISMFVANFATQCYLSMLRSYRPELQQSAIAELLSQCGVATPVEEFLESVSAVLSKSTNKIICTDSWKSHQDALTKHNTRKDFTEY